MELVLTSGLVEQCADRGKEYEDEDRDFSNTAVQQHSSVTGLMPCNHCVAQLAGQVHVGTGFCPMFSYCRRRCELEP